MCINDGLGGFQFRIVDGRKQVSTNGGSTWENFSNGDYKFCVVTLPSNKTFVSVPTASKPKAILHTYAITTTYKLYYQIWTEEGTSDNEYFDLNDFGNATKVTDSLQNVTVNSFEVRQNYSNNRIEGLIIYVL